MKAHFKEHPEEYEEFLKATKAMGIEIVGEWNPFLPYLEGQTFCGYDSCHGKNSASNNALSCAACLLCHRSGFSAVH